MRIFIETEEDEPFIESMGREVERMECEGGSKNGNKVRSWQGK